MDKARVRVYLDDNPKPIIDQALPTDVTLDTRSLADGPHRLLIRAQGQSGHEGIEEISFHVHNGPGIIAARTIRSIRVAPRRAHRFRFGYG